MSGPDTEKLLVNLTLWKGCTSEYRSKHKGPGDERELPNGKEMMKPVKQEKEERKKGLGLGDVDCPIKLNVES